MISNRFNLKARWEFRNFEFPWWPIVAAILSKMPAFYSLSPLCCPTCPCPQSLLTRQFAIHSVCCSLLFRFTSSSCMLAGHFWRHTTRSPQKKVHHFCNNSYVSYLFFSSSVSHSLQNEKIFNRNCIKDSDSTSSKVSLTRSSHHLQHRLHQPHPHSFTKPIFVVPVH